MTSIVPLHIELNEISLVKPKDNKQKSITMKASQLDSK